MERKSSESLPLRRYEISIANLNFRGGAYLTPKEMEALTEGWRPYRSLAVFYMWPVAGE